MSESLHAIALAWPDERQGSISSLTPLVPAIENSNPDIPATSAPAKLATSPTLNHTTIQEDETQINTEIDAPENTTIRNGHKGHEPEDTNEVSEKKIKTKFNISRRRPQSAGFSSTKVQKDANKENDVINGTDENKPGTYHKGENTNKVLFKKNNKSEISRQRPRSAYSGKMVQNGIHGGATVNQPDDTVQGQQLIRAWSNPMMFDRPSTIYSHMTRGNVASSMYVHHARHANLRYLFLLFIFIGIKIVEEGSFFMTRGYWLLDRAKTFLG